MFRRLYKGVTSIYSRKILMKKIFILVLLSIAVHLAQASDLHMVSPNTPGSTTDLAGKAIAESFEKLTGQKIILENVGGGNQIPGLLNWKKKPIDSVMMTTTTLLVFNPKMLKYIPYKDSDFDHVTMIASVPFVWVVKDSAPYKNLQDLSNNLPRSNKPFVAFSNYPQAVNAMLLKQKKTNWANDVNLVRYKGDTEVVTGLLEGSVEAAVVTSNAALISTVQAGKIRILASTESNDILIAGQNVPSASKILGVQQFSGGIFLSLKSGLDPIVAKRLQQNLMLATSDPLVLKRLQQQNTPPVNLGPEHMEKFVNDYRVAISNLQFELD